MMSNVVVINKKYECGIPSFSIQFRGLEEAGSSKQMEEVLDNIFSEKWQNIPILDVIQKLKTVFRNSKKYFLELDIKEENKRILATLEDGNLSFYQSVVNRSSLDIIKVSYTSEKGLFVKTSNYDTSLLSHMKKNDFGNYIDSQLEIIGKINDLKVITLDYDDRKICSFYQAIYLKNPDFSLDSTILEVQTMLILLDFYGGNMDCSFDFYNASSSKMFREDVLSSTFLDKLKRLAPLGEIAGSDISSFSRKQLERLEYIRKLILECSKKKENFSEVSKALIDFCAASEYNTTISDKQLLYKYPMQK